MTHPSEIEDLPLTKMTRTTGMDDGSWADEPAPAPRPAATAEDLISAVTVLGDVGETIRTLPKVIVQGVAWQVAAEPETVVAFAALIQAHRKTLADIEAYVIREIGRSAHDLKGALADGRLYELRKGAVRKAWDHAGWQADVRREVLSGVTEAVEPGTGEAIDLHALLSGAQAAHGASAPKATVLKLLGLDPADYSETYPGPWTLQVSAPEAVA